MSSGAPIRRGGGESVTRSDRRQRELVFDRPLPPLAPPLRMTRRDWVLGVAAGGLAPETKKLTLGFEPVTPGFKNETKGQRCSCKLRLF